MYQCNAGTGTNITFSGAGTLATYQQALASVEYFNGATEPSADMLRLVEFQVFDGVFLSNTAMGLVNISLVDDNPLLLSCSPGLLSFSEGSTEPVSLASLLTLSDLDSDHVVLSVSVDIANAQEGDEIMADSGVVAESITIQQNGVDRVYLTGEARAMEYQVC